MHATYTLALSALLAATYAATPSREGPWRDPSPHRAIKVQITADVQLEVLDWGGTGPTLVFLAGFGNSAHVFDGFAPRFANGFHVIGISRRGMGASSRPARGYDSTTLASDIVTVLDSLGVDRGSFVAHSFGGSELNYLAAYHPSRIHRLVYLDAGFDFQDLYQSPGWLESFPVPRPPTASYDDNTVNSWVLRAERMSGPGYPESEIRQQLRFDSSGNFVEPTISDSLAAWSMRGALPARFERMHSPVLAVYADPGTAPVAFPYWNTLDPTARAKIRKAFDIQRRIIDRQIDLFNRSVERVRVVRMPGARHYLFLTHAGEVAHEILAFLEQRN
jgi:pimeloyl-ACP methyl ester carboxylesterase